MNNEYRSAESTSLPELQPVFRIKRTEVWGLARTALHQASPDGGQNTNYVHAMGLLVHAAAFIGELAMVNGKTVDEVELVSDACDLNKFEMARLMDAISAAAGAKGAHFVD